ncbi:hypothetical protein JL720_3637 [Aureococcus anophagefferens]|nr:hypothetical protein JL720_3637 [Aureococcus anophagefferens]
MRRLIVALLVAVAWSFGGPAKPYPTGAYDASSARAYFGRRPLRVAARSLEILWRSAGFARRRRRRRGGGPLARGRTTAAASSRTCSSRSARRAGAPARGRPAFAAEARAIIAAELGSAASKLRDVSPEPVAAASLGQVHRGVGRAAVAVKVQRPGVEDRVALDMYLVREFAAPLAASLGAPGDVVGIADAWGAGLVGELDYEAEGANAAAFGEKLAASSLDGRVFAPAVVADATSRRVLTTEWVDGERLDETARDDACEAREFGDEQLHVPGDLVRLGFVPEGGEDAAADAGVVDLLTRAYSKRAEGGGFANFDVPGLIDELRGLSADAGAAIFQIPPYFAYIAKAFATLEGIGLGVDPDYSILNDTLPYIRKDALRPAARGRARPSSSARPRTTRARVLDADRVGSLLDGARRYASTDVAVALALGARTRRLWADARRRSGGAGGDRSVLGSWWTRWGSSAGRSSPRRTIAAPRRSTRPRNSRRSRRSRRRRRRSRGPARARVGARFAPVARREDLSVVTRRVAAESARQTADRLRIK